MHLLPESHCEEVGRVVGTTPQEQGGSLDFSSSPGRIKMGSGVAWYFVLPSQRDSRIFLGFGGLCGSLVSHVTSAVLTSSERQSWPLHMYKPKILLVVSDAFSHGFSFELHSKAWGWAWIRSWYR